MLPYCPQYIRFLTFFDSYQAPGSFDEFWKEIVQSDKRTRNQQRSTSGKGLQSASRSGGNFQRREKFQGKDKNKWTNDNAKQGANKNRQADKKKEETVKDSSKKEIHAANQHTDEVDKMDTDRWYYFYAKYWDTLTPDSLTLIMLNKLRCPAHF